MTTVAPLIDPELDADRLVADPEVDELLQGAVDMHVHPAPSPFPRRITIADAARDAASMGFHAIVVKSHHHCMQPDILSLGTELTALPITVASGIALNDYVGGLNPYAVELAIAFGAKVVWFPTVSSAAHIAFHQAHTHSKFPRSGVALRQNKALSILDADGKAKPEVHDIVEQIAAAGIVLNCGHLPAAEVEVLIATARTAGVERIVVSHPAFVIDAPPARVAEWARAGVFVEHCLIMLVGDPAVPPNLDVYRPFAGIGAAQTIFGSDLGQRGHPLPATGFRRIARMLLDDGEIAANVRRMVGANAAALLS